MNRKLEGVGKFGPTLAAVEIGIVLFAVLGMILLALLYSPGLGQGVLEAMRYGVLLVNAAAGFLVGLEFPLAGRLYYRSGGGEEVVRTAGALYAADLFGAFIGSLLVGVILIPALGILQTCVVILFLKVTSLAFIRLSVY